ncbi:MAG: prolyl oligopeptidase family serine peptidase [Flavobacteriaceae bacterium]|nr:prolyl oligopeptidase family serine peptidase [Flavobacteriaceae bacterium]MDG2504339.1 prolyl oligopeptidase family serine peptidase [Flavobacteriaceae bacterium]
MKRFLILTLILTLLSCQQNTQKVNYPSTEKIPVTDSYFDTEVVDNYRWLEDDKSQETEEWVGKQNQVTFSFLDQIPFRSQLKNRLEQIWNYEKLSAPFQEGEYTYFYKNNGLQNQYVVYRQKEGEETEVFIDPNTFAEDGTTSLAGLNFSKSGKLAAYSISEGGSDWRKIIVLDAVQKTILEDTIVDVKFSGIEWKLDEGFFYSSYDKPEGSELSDMTDQHKLYYHKLGTSQAEDELVYGGTPEQKHRYVGASVTEDGRYLIISGSKTTSGNVSFLKNLSVPNSPLVPMDEDYNSDSYILSAKGSQFYIVTNKNAPNQKVVSATANRPQEKYWRDFIPETEHVLSPSSGSGYFFAKYMVDAITKVYQYDSKGNNMGEVKLPGIGTAGGFSGKKEVDLLYFSFTNYHSPGVIYSYDPKTQASKKYWSPEIDFNPDDYISTQVFYTSNDGTKVPMIITHKKGVNYNGKNPTILYGYGGFNISLRPSFSITNAIWMEQGGVYAVPNIRGGGEYGKEWHQAGIQQKKQNVFDDFIAAAEYLIAENITSPEFLAVRGGSNGGLLVGAVMTQRPELVKVALPAVGVLDMLRYHKFTSGAGWSYDYGTSEDSAEMFTYLKGYSPVHNVNTDTRYPATLITTGDHDDRVVPAHSFKFAAELQDKQQGDNPVLIRIETNAGHGAGTPVSKTIEQYADIFGFTFYNMGFRVLPETITNKPKG